MRDGACGETSCPLIACTKLKSCSSTIRICLSLDLVYPTLAPLALALKSPPMIPLASGYFARIACSASHTRRCSSACPAPAW